MIRLILDTDIGDDVDDAFALAYAVRHPEIELLAVTTVWGDVRWRAALALRLLDELDAAHVPVAAGWGGPPQGGPPRLPACISGDVLLRPRARDRRTDPRHGVELIRDAALANEGPVWLVTVGPATNAAAALRRYPELRDRLAGVAMMGGRRNPADAREYNFSSDPEAAAAVCDSGLDVRVGDYLVTCQARLTLDDLPALRRAPGVGQSLAAMLETYVRRRGRHWTCMYDPASLTLVLGERFLTLDPQPLRAKATDGHVHFRASDRPTRLRVAAAIDAAAFQADLLGVIGGEAE